MRNLNDEYNAIYPSDAVDGYEYQSSAEYSLNDVILAVELLASHVKNLYRRTGVQDDEISMEIDAIIHRMRRHD